MYEAIMDLNKNVNACESSISLQTFKSWFGSMIGRPQTEKERKCLQQMNEAFAKQNMESINKRYNSNKEWIETTQENALRSFQANYKFKMESIVRFFHDLHEKIKNKWGRGFALYTV